MVERGLRTRRVGFLTELTELGKFITSKQGSVPHIANMSAVMDIAV
jgi:hypothetical protein